MFMSARMPIKNAVANSEFCQNEFATIVSGEKLGTRKEYPCGGKANLSQLKQ
jgi:hypothetical protein